MTKIRVPKSVARELRAEQIAEAELSGVDLHAAGGPSVGESEQDGWDVSIGERMQRVSAEAFLYVLKRLKNNMAAIEMFRLDEPWLLNKCEREGLTEADVYRAAGIWSDIFASIFYAESSPVQVLMADVDRRIEKGRRLEEWIEVAKRKVGEQA